MKMIKWVFINGFRHKLRTVLTILGIAIAVLAFCLMRTVVTAWHSGVEAAAQDRLVVHHAVSFFSPLPLAYRDRIANMPGVARLTYQNWFGGVYIDRSNFFARWAVDADTFFDVYPEFLLGDKELEDFRLEKNACVVGSKTADRYGLKIGDMMTLEGEEYPGKWDFVVRGIYRPRFKTTDATQMFLHWEYLNERMLQDSPERANEIGLYVIKLRDSGNAAALADRIDNLFKNSPAETKTESESVLQRWLLSSWGSLFQAINGMSFVIVGIIMLILANTMAMSARERTREYAILKAIGFRTKHLTSLILAESLWISAFGGAMGLALTFPMVSVFESIIPKGTFPVFHVTPITIIMTLCALLGMAVLSSLFPIQRASTMKIVDGFRFVG